MRTLALLLLCGMAVGQEAKPKAGTSYQWDSPDPKCEKLIRNLSTLEHWCVTNSDCNVSPKPEPMDVPAVGGDSVAPDTCTDKRRVLLTSEDGAKHCILFPKE